MTSDPKWFEAKRQKEIDEIKLDLDDEYKPVLEEVTKLEVEDSALAAVEEAKEEPADTSEHVKKFHAEHDIPKKKKRVYPAYMLGDLRKRDRYFNRTCSVCYRRVLLKQIQDGKGEVCDDCREN